MNRIPCLAALLLLAACNPQEAVAPQNTPAPSAPADAAQPAAAAGPRSVVNWSPQTIAAGGEFNVQRDGNSGISFELDRPVPAGDVTLTFDGKPLAGVVASGVIVTATIPRDYLATAGSYPVRMTLPGSAEAIEVGNFEVK